ncbi:MAG: hypothetical protein ACLTTU_06410 [Bilophila wadsworthia]
MTQPAEYKENVLPAPCVRACGRSPRGRLVEVRGPTARWSACPVCESAPGDVPFNYIGHRRSCR